MNLTIITPEERIFEGEADLVQLPGSDGLFGILKNHAPMIASLGKGKVKIALNGTLQYIEINGGVAKVSENEIIVLAD